MVDLKDFIVVRENEKSSRKLYKTTCDSCNKDRGYKRNSVGPYCKICFGHIKHTAKIVSKETKAKMSASNWLKNGGMHPLLGKTHSIETKVKISCSTATQNKNRVTKHTYQGPNGIMSMRSGWEVKYAQYLDTKGIKWQYEPTFILSNGRAYLPDFQLSTGDIIEVKGYMREDARIKWEMFCQEHPELNKSLITKIDMKQLSLI